ncbi:hypothetical protein MNBD_GAMMA12-1838 [hydrothermal vent metagenome]|uniref:Type IV / VI secretion system DotU domain-containing protein n=1 Tax=hydrothermal vent metagenome TaxID=652676 RepID=A0A3B0YHE8_9ZZZZ
MSQQGLLRYCTPVINLYSELMWMDETLSDVSDLCQELRGLINAIEADLIDAGFHKTIIKHTSYSLCCAIDVAMIRVTGVSGENMSDNESLLQSIHGEVPATSKLLILARTILDQKSKVDDSELLGLIYLLLEMGYAEQIQISVENQEMLSSIKSDVAKKLSTSHQAMKQVMQHGFITEVKLQKRQGKMPFWVSISIVILTLIAVHRIADIFLMKYYEVTIEHLQTLSDNHKR